MADSTDDRTGQPRFAAALAEGGDWAEAAKACLDRLPRLAGANQGFLYVSDALADQLGSIVTLFRGVSGVEHWVGTVGMGVCAIAGGEARTLGGGPAVAALIGRFPPGALRLLPAMTDGLDALDEAATWLALHRPTLALVHGNPNNGKLMDLVQGVAQRTGAYLVGGLTAGRGEPAQVAGRTVSTGGLSGLLVGAEVEVATALTQGCRPLGPAHTVTAADRAVIMELDGRPALDVFRAEIGPELAADLRRVAGPVTAALPVRGSDTGEYLVRDLMAIDPVRGWIAIAEGAAVGDTLLFCRRDRDAAAADMDRMLASLKRRLGGRTPAGALYLSCIARGPDASGLLPDEVERIARVLGDVPLAGFYAAGELSNGRLHSYSGVLTLFL